MAEQNLLRELTNAKLNELRCNLHDTALVIPYIEFPRVIS